MKLVVGLGNPGRRYVDTRHNIGSEVLFEVARRHATGKPRNQFHGEMVEASLNGAPARLLFPQTYMNRSGTSVAAAVNFFKLDLQDLLVICDCLDLPQGKLRFRARGSAGGQRGVEDVIRCLGTEEFPRLRLGIGRPPEGWDAAEYVLGKCTEEELEVLRPVVQKAADAVVDWANQGIVYCMNHYH